MTVTRVRLDPEKPLACVQNLRFIAHPRGTRDECVTLKDVEECEKQRLGSRRNDNLLRLNPASQAARLKASHGLKRSLSVGRMDMQGKT